MLGMAFEICPGSSAASFKRKSSCSLQDEYECGSSVSMQKTDSHEAKVCTLYLFNEADHDWCIDSQRRRTPTNNELSFLEHSVLHVNPLSPTAVEDLRQQHELLSLHHPSLFAPQQSFSFYSPQHNHSLNGQQLQSSNPSQKSPIGFSHFGLGSSEDNDDEMMVDGDIESGFTATTSNSINFSNLSSITTINLPQMHSHTAPPSPITSGTVTPSGFDDIIHPIRFEGTKHQGHPRDMLEDPNANLWNGGGRVLRKNMDGQVKGFKMGYLEGCEKCRVKARGHFGHFIMADSVWKSYFDEGLELVGVCLWGM